MQNIVKVYKFEYFPKRRGAGLATILLMLRQLATTGQRTVYSTVVNDSVCLWELKGVSTPYL